MRVVAVVALLAWGFSQPVGVLTPAPLAFLAVLAVALEATAVRLPAGGFASPAGACSVAAALLPGGGFAPAALIAGLALLARTLRFGAPWQAVADLVPPLAAAALAGTPYPYPLALQGYVLAVAVVGPRGRLFPLMAAAGFTGLALALLLRGGLAPALLLVPALLALRAAMEVPVRREQEAKDLFLQQELEEARSAVQASSVRVNELKTSLEGRLEEYLLLEELATQVARADGLAATAGLLVRMTERLMPCRSVALFVGGEAVALRTPERETVEAAALLQVVEPVVEDARERRRLVTQAKPPVGPRLFVGDTAAVALPLEDVGVLYVGRDAPFGEPEVRVLRVVAGQAAVAVQSALRSEARNEALAREAEARAGLESWVAGLDRLLAEVRGLSALLDRQALQSALEAAVARLVPHDAMQLVTDLAHPHPVVEAVVQSRRPLLLEDAEQSRFAGLGCGSLLGVPMLVEDRCIGALVVMARATGAFVRQDQELLAVFAYQAAAALENARLHAEVLEAYARLQESEAQLVQSAKLAAVGQLAAGVAHELNTPLGAILLALDSSERMLPDRWEQAVTRLQKASATVKRAQAIIERLLYYSRDAGKGRQETDLAGVLRDTVELLERQLSLDGVEVELTLGEAPRVVCNQNEVYQVVTNLILNARDALQGCEDRVVRVGLSGGEGEAVITVADAGPGMPPEVRDRVFEPFFTTKPVGEGTGLGLSVSLGIVEGHGGTMEVDSEPGRGTEFRVRLPA